MPPRVYEKKFILIIIYIYISSFTFQHEHYFQSTYGVGYNKSPPYEVPKELIHLKGTDRDLPVLKMGIHKINFTHIHS